jgi:hypothetical protein
MHGGQDTNQKSHIMDEVEDNVLSVWLGPIMYTPLCVYQQISLQQVEAPNCTA